MTLSTPHRRLEELREARGDKERIMQIIKEAEEAIDIDKCKEKIVYFGIILNEATRTDN